MLLLLLFVVVALALGGVFVTARDDVLADARPDEADVELPPGRIVPEDLRAVRFGMVFRGYRMREVDDVLDRLAQQLAERDERITDLERVLAEVAEPVVAEAEEAQKPAPPPSRSALLHREDAAHEAAVEGATAGPLPDRLGHDAPRTSVPEPTTAAFEWPVHAAPAEPATPPVDPWSWSAEAAVEAEEAPSAVPEESAAAAGHVEDGLDFPEIPAAEPADKPAAEAVEPGDERERSEG